MLVFEETDNPVSQTDNSFRKSNVYIRDIRLAKFGNNCGLHMIRSYKSQKKIKSEIINT